MQSGVMSGVTIELSESVSEAIRLPEAERIGRLHLELAASLYAQDLISLGKAAELAGKPLWAFQLELSRRDIPLHYTEIELKEDIGYARGGQ